MELRKPLAHYILYRNGDHYECSVGTAKELHDSLDMDKIEIIRHLCARYTKQDMERILAQPQEDRGKAIKQIMESNALTSNPN